MSGGLAFPCQGNGVRHIRCASWCLCLPELAACNAVVVGTCHVRNAVAPSRCRSTRLTVIGLPCVCLLQVEIPVSPFSKKPTPERPPTFSYNATEVGPGWVDLHEGKQGPPYNPYVQHHTKVRGGIPDMPCHFLKLYRVHARSFFVCTACHVTT